MRPRVAELAAGHHADAVAGRRDDVGVKLLALLVGACEICCASDLPVGAMRIRNVIVDIIAEAKEGGGTRDGRSAE